MSMGPRTCIAKVSGLSGKSCGARPADRIPGQNSMSQFVHLHVHTEYSLVDSIVRVPELMASVSSQGMASVALTDVDNLFALVKFYPGCTAERCQAYHRPRGPGVGPVGRGSGFQGHIPLRE